MKEMLLAIIIIISTNVFADNFVNGKCYMPSLSVKHDVNGDFFSDHSIEIKNETNSIQTYHVIYSHELTNISSPHTQEFDINLFPAQTYIDTQRFNTKIKLRSKGNYATKAKTYAIRVSDNQRMGYCESNNNMSVF